LQWARIFAIADQAVGDEAERAAVDDAVGEEKRSAALLDAQHRVIGRDRVHLERDDVGGEPVAKGESLDRWTILELIEPGLVAENRAVEAPCDLGRVAQVMPGREDDPLDPTPVEPLDSLIGQQGVDRRP
jgi:hypothetical protein